MIDHVHRIGSPLTRAQNALGETIEHTETLIGLRGGDAPGYRRVRDLLGEAYDALGAVVADPDGEYRVRVEDDPEPDFSYLTQTELADVNADELVSLLLTVEHRHEGQPWQWVDSMGDVHVHRSADVESTYTADDVRALLRDEEEGSPLLYLAGTMRDMLPDSLV